MCQECGFITGHANTCPNNPDIYEPILTDCVLCGREVDEIETTYGICEKCWTDYHNFDNALAYGAAAHVKNCAEINGFYAYILTPEQIDAALRQVVMDMKKYYYDFAIETADSFLRDDDGDFADWLKERKENE